MVVKENTLERGLNDSSIFTAEQIREVAELIEDENKIHYDPAEARKLDLQDIIMPGAYLTAVSEIVGKIEDEADAKLIRQRTSFKNPVYPHKKLEWYVEAVPGRKKITGKEENNQINITSDLYFGDTQIYEPGEGKIIYAETFDPRSKISRFFRILGAKTEGKISQAYFQARIPTTLVKFLNEANQTSGKKVLGINRSMDTNFYDILKSEPATIKVYLANNPKVGENGGIYKFRTVILQDNLPKLSSDITCFTNGELDVHQFEHRYN